MVVSAVGAFVAAFVGAYCVGSARLARRRARSHEPIRWTDDRSFEQDEQIASQMIAAMHVKAVARVKNVGGGQ